MRASHAVVIERSIRFAGRRRSRVSIPRVSRFAAPPPGLGRRSPPARGRSPPARRRRPPARRRRPAGRPVLAPDGAEPLVDLAALREPVLRLPDRAASELNRQGIPQRSPPLDAHGPDPPPAPGNIRETIALEDHPETEQSHDLRDLPRADAGTRTPDPFITSESAPNFGHIGGLPGSVRKMARMQASPGHKHLGTSRHLKSPDAARSVRFAAPLQHRFRGHVAFGGRS